MRFQHFPIDRTYTSRHGWLALAPGDRPRDYPLRAGLTPIAVGERTVVAVTLPAVRRIVEAGMLCGAVTVAGGPDLPIYAPIGGLVTIHNADMLAQPELLSRDAFHAGWLFAVLPAPDAPLSGLLTRARYLEQISATV